MTTSPDMLKLRNMLSVEASHQPPIHRWVTDLKMHQKKTMPLLVPCLGNTMRAHVPPAATFFPSDRVTPSGCGQSNTYNHE